MIDPKWGLDALISQLKATRFRAQGFDRSYWEFYEGFKFVTVFLLLCAVLAWQLASLPQGPGKYMQATAWILAASFVATTGLAWKYLFAVPLLLSAVIAVLLVLGAAMIS